MAQTFIQKVNRPQIQFIPLKSKITHTDNIIKDKQPNELGNKSIKTTHLGI
jgi:hypothetical protein